MPTIKLDNWTLSSSENAAKAKIFSTLQYDNANDYKALMPGTVMGTLVNAGEYKEPFKGTNLKEIPKDRFQTSWWYRTVFDLTKEQAGKTVTLTFEGINHSANIWLNGECIATKEQVYGTYRQFTFDVSKQAVSGSNVLAVEVFKPQPGDYAIGYVDWNPYAPDDNMGLFRPVILKTCDRVAIDHPFVETVFPREDFSVAELTVNAELTNYVDAPVSGTLNGRIEDKTFSQDVTLKAGENLFWSLKANVCPELVIENPRVWNPVNLGEPHLYDLELEFIIDNQIADQNKSRFGIRTVKDYVNEGGHRGYKVNGQKVLIRSGGWADELFLMETDENLETQIEYVKHMNLNSIRLEGFWGKDHKIYDLCDENGILMMVGWSCHWEHEQYLGKPVDNRYGGPVSKEDIALIAESWQHQMLWLRHHPSIFVWAVASDKNPHPDLEREYVKIFEKYDTTRPYLNSTGGYGSEQGIITDHEIVSEISGSSRVKMLGPYAYTPPVYWYTDTKLGGAYGFNTETGPGEQPPVLKSLKEMLPEEHRWPIDEVWEFHCGLNEFRHLDRFNRAMEHRFGKPDSLESFSMRAQLLNYELQRPMFEAFQANKGRATGVVQWMLNAAWPKLYWQLYDHALRPNAAYYSTRLGCRPLNAIYHYGEHAVYGINDFLSEKPVTVTVKVYDLNANGLFEKTITQTLDADSSEKLLDLPTFDEPVVLLDLRVLEVDGQVMAPNMYWLSSKPDVLDYDTKDGLWSFYTASKEFADYKALNDLPETEISIKAGYDDKSRQVNIVLENKGNDIAFFMEMEITGSKDEEIMPVFWLDNYITVMPKEKRVITATLGKDVNSIPGKLSITGWNVKEITYQL